MQLHYASILPLAFDLQGRAFVLLAAESDTGQYSDFGGSPEIGENPRQTAIREAWEESNAVIHRNVLNDFPLYMILQAKHSLHFVVLLPFDYAYRMNEAFELFETCKIPCANGCGEKVHAAWFDMKDLHYWKSLTRAEFRKPLKLLHRHIMKERNITP